jgi:ribonucleotide reductase beta subunit family protein with ferritin-like domain
VEIEKRNSLIKAWEENEKAKADNKYVAKLYSPVSHIASQFCARWQLSVVMSNIFFFGYFCEQNYSPNI